MTPQDQPTAPQKIQLVPKNQVFASLFALKTAFFHYGNAERVPRLAPSRSETPFSATATLKMGGGGVTPQDQPTAPQKIQLVPKNQVFASLFALKTAIFHYGNAERVHRVAPSRSETPFSATATLKIGG